MSTKQTARPFRFRRRKTVPGIARELLRCFEDESRWTRHAVARDANGVETRTDDGAAVCWCLAGALTEVVGPFPLLPGAQYYRFSAAFWDATRAHLEDVNDTRGLPYVRRVLRKLAKGKR